MSEDLIEVFYGVIIVCIYQTDVVLSKIQELRTRVEQTVRLGLYTIHVNYRCEGDTRCWEKELQSLIFNACPSRKGNADPRVESTVFR